MKPGNKIAATEIYALAFGLFLGLAFWKFGNPVILDHKIISPSTPSEFWNDAWPTHWANWIFLPLALAGALVVFKKIRICAGWPASKLALAAAAAVVWLAVYFRDTNRGCRFDRDDALAIFWLRRVLFYRRAGDWSAGLRRALEFKL